MTHYPSYHELDNMLKGNKISIDDITLNDIKESLVYCENNAPILQFKSFEERNVETLLKKNYKPNEGSLLSQVAKITMTMFNTTKVLLESKSDSQKEKCLSILNEKLADPIYSTLEVLSPYLNQLLLIDIKKTTYSNISAFKSKYDQSSFTYLSYLSNLKNNDEELFSNPEKLGCYYINPNSFVNFIELQIELAKTLNIPVNQLEIINRSINFILGFYSFAAKNNLCQYNEIVNTLLKGLISYSIEIIVKDFAVLPKQSIEQLLNTYLKISFELQINSNEVYLFSTLSLLILYTNLDYITIVNFNMILNSGHSNELLVQCKKIIKDTGVAISSGNIVVFYLILIKLFEFILVRKQTKDLNKIRSSIGNVNLSDFIISDYAFYPKTYDQFKQSITNFKEKMYWNFCELCTSVFMKKLQFPKVQKKIIMRYLCYEPDCKTLLYNLIQYYYANKNFRKTKILIKKLLSSISIENSNQIDFDIETIVLFINSHIFLNEEKYKEAKDLCVLNLKRLDKSTNQTFLSRCYIFLGFSYSKLGDYAYNSDERNHNHTMALKYFEQAQKYSKNNPAFTFYFAHQLFQLKRYEDCQKYLAECEMSNLHLFQLRIMLHIAMLEYDQALEICKTVFKTIDHNHTYFYITYLLKFYIQIYLQINYPTQDGEEKLIQSIATSIDNIYDKFTTKINQLTELINKAYESKREDDPLKEIKKVIRFETNDISEKQFNESQSKLKHEVRHLENTKAEMIKNFYLLANYMKDNGIDQNNQIFSKIKDKILVKGISSEDVNNLLISAIHSEFSGNDIDTEMLLKKVLDINPTHMHALKLFVSFLIKNKKDYSNAYVYCIKAIKIDDKEIRLWEFLSQYYLNLNDQTKYYECMMKELENSKFHNNAFLSGLIPKVIL